MDDNKAFLILMCTLIICGTILVTSLVWTEHLEKVKQIEMGMEVK